MPEAEMMDKEIDKEGDKEGDAELKALREEKSKLQESLEASKKEISEKLHQEELSRVKIESELNALKTLSQTQAAGNSGQVSEEQWKALEESTGVSRQVYITSAQIAQQQIELVKKELAAKLKDAEDKAAQSQERLEKLSSERSLDSITRDFYEAKPQYSRHKKDIEEFVSMFQESDRKDPEKLKNILSKAETYVKGKVGGAMRINPGGSPKLGAETGEEDNIDSESVIIKGLQNESQIRTVKGIKRNLDSDGQEKKENLLARFQSTDKEGVVYSAGDEWEEAQVKSWR